MTSLLPDVLPTTLHRERLYNDRWVVVAGPGNPSVTDEVTVEVLRTLPHVVFEAGGRRLPVYSVLDALGIGCTAPVRCPDFLTIPFVVADSGALAIVQNRIASRFEAAGLVRTFPMPVDLPEIGIDMVWNPRLAEDPARAWLREQLLAAVPRE